MKHLHSAAALVAAFACARAATAADPSWRDSPAIEGQTSLNTSGAESACPGPERGARLHDGFFARSDTGFAFVRAIVSASDVRLRRTGIRAYGQGAGISLGGTPAPGVVVGGTVWTARMDPVFVEDGKTVTPDDDSVKVTLLRLGPFLDFYPDPRRGFHVFTAAAFTAQVETDVKGNAVEPSALGAALSIGPGYEWFIMNQLSLGLLGRVSLGRLVRTPREGEQHILWIVPELSVTATYH